MKKNQVFIDSSAFVAWLYENDAFHQDAVQKFAQIEKLLLTPCTSSFVIDETATVLSYRQGQDLARKFIDFAEKLPMIFISEEIRQDVHKVFTEQKKKGTSIVDCSNVVVMRRLDISHIFTYDQIFSSHFHLSTFL